MNTDSVLDVDWACDEVLEYTIDFLEKNQLKATFFITHDTPLLERLRKSPLFELGIHPNFQYLLNGTSEFHDMEEALDYILAIVPEAVSVRSHCLVQSSPILELFRRKGLRYEVNLFIPWSNSISLKPIWHYNGLLRIPYFWEDDFQCLQKLKTGWEAVSLLQYSGLKIFNFHPIHLYINTENIKRYEKAKEYLKKPKKLIRFKYIGMGAFSFLSTLNEAIKNMGKKQNALKKLLVIMMKVAIIGRTGLLFNTMKLLVAHGHDIVLIGTCKAAPEYEVTEIDFEQYAELHGIPLFAMQIYGMIPLLQC